MPSMSVSTPRRNRRVQRLNVVQTTCDKVKKWYNLPNVHIAINVHRNQFVEAPIVPVPKVPRHVGKSKGDSRTGLDTQSDQMITIEYFIVVLENLVVGKV